MDKMDKTNNIKDKMDKMDKTNNIKDKMDKMDKKKEPIFKKPIEKKYDNIPWLCNVSRVNLDGTQNINKSK